MYKMNYKEQSDKKTIFVNNIKLDKVDKKKKDSTACKSENISIRQGSSIIYK